MKTKTIVAIWSCNQKSNVISDAVQENGLKAMVSKQFLGDSLFGQFLEDHNRLVVGERTHSLDSGLKRCDASQRSGISGDRNAMQCNAIEWMARKRVFLVFVVFVGSRHAQ